MIASQLKAATKQVQSVMKLIRDVVKPSPSLSLNFIFIIRNRINNVWESIFISQSHINQVSKDQSRIQRTRQENDNVPQKSKILKKFQTQYLRYQSAPCWETRCASTLQACYLNSQNLLLTAIIKQVPVSLVNFMTLWWRLISVSH